MEGRNVVNKKQRKREMTRNYKNKHRREVKEKGCRQKQ